MRLLSFALGHGRCNAMQYHLVMQFSFFLPEVFGERDFIAMLLRDAGA